MEPRRIDFSYQTILAQLRDIGKSESDNNKIERLEREIVALECSIDSSFDLIRFKNREIMKLEGNTK